MLTESQTAVTTFNKVFGLPVSDVPRMLESHRVTLRAKWMQGEISEFQAAGEIADQVDAVIDLIYFAIGVLVEMGIDGSTAFELVHEANMKKLPAQGTPFYDQEGKVLKPEGWVSPREDIRRWLSNELRSKTEKRS